MEFFKKFSRFPNYLKVGMDTLNYIIPYKNNSFILVYFFLQREAGKTM